MKLLNINSIVQLKLTDLGKEHYKKYWDKIAIPDFNFEEYLSKKTWNGWTEFIFWEVMKIFGETVGIGLPNLFETNIKIEETGLSDI